MKPTKMSAKRLISIINKNRGQLGEEYVTVFLENIWNEGYNGRIAYENGIELKPEEKLFVIKRAENYRIECPTCGQGIQIDFNELAADLSKEAVEDVIEATGWGKPNVEKEFEDDERRSNQRTERKD